MIVQFVSYITFLRERCRRLSVWLSAFSCDLEEIPITVATDGPRVFHINSFKFDAEEFSLPACKDRHEFHLRHIIKYTFGEGFAVNRMTMLV